MRQITKTVLTTTLGVTLTCSMLLGSAGCASSVERTPTAETAFRAGWDEPELDRRDGRYWVQAQPSPAGLQAFRDAGGVKVINLRSESEMEQRVGFDEPEQARRLGLAYTQIPISLATFDAERVRAFGEAVDSAEGDVLIHCASGGRASGMLAAHLALNEGATMQEAIARGEAVGMGRTGRLSNAVRGLVLSDVDDALAMVDADRVKRDVDTLASFGTRHTMSETESDSRGIGAARRWLKRQFELASAASGRTGDDAIKVYFDTHRVEADGRRITQDVDVVNVACEIPGAMPEARERVYLVVAHYDSRALDPNDATSDAPGANDDASGVAVCLELARVISKLRLDSTVILMPTAGEEQGLFGARRHARASREAGMDIRAVLSNDTVGDPTGVGGREARDKIRVFSEGLPAAVVSGDGVREGGVNTLRRLSAENDGPSRQVARAMAEVAEIHNLDVQPMLVYRPDRFLRGGDHTGYNEVGYPAVRLIEVYENYDRQHQDVRTENGRVFGDLAEYVDAEYLAGVTRLNLATLIHLANAPREPSNARIIVAGLTNDTTLRWDASPEPDVAGYEVVWRETTSHVWEEAEDVGNVTEATIDLSKDNWFFGVRSYDQQGYRSPVVFPIAARE